MPTPLVSTSSREDLIDRTLAEVLDRPRCARHPRARLDDDLSLLVRMARLSRAAPLRWQRAVRPRRLELALWVWGVALAVAAAGLEGDAAALLDVLPGVAAGADGRSELLADLIEDARSDAALSTLIAA
ncbi:MAG: hypothetical protein EXR79_03360 [Myxococcales bacterium]|nr:hypothetical protein [Myxococcales bacterium]